MRLLNTIFLVACIFFLLEGTALAQSNVNNLHQMTTLPSNARFEIIQSQIAAKWTFRLDRYTGTVCQLVKTKNDRNFWEQMPVKGIPKIQGATVPRFILFASGIAARHTFLMDSITGKTWVVVEAEVSLEQDETATVYVWEPFEE